MIFVPDNCMGPISEPEHVIKYDSRTLRSLMQAHFSIVALTSIRDKNHEMPVLFAHVTTSGLRGRVRDPQPSRRLSAHDATERK